MDPMLTETLIAVLDLIALICILLGAMLCVAASVGLLRFPDILSRQHAATKPQVLGVLLILLAVALTQRSVAVFTMVALVVVFQLLTAPVSSQMMSRAAVRTSQVELGRVEADPINPAHPPTPRRRRGDRSEKGEKDRSRKAVPEGEARENPEGNPPARP
ncbi:monovalent cation/H(+) antiporter subunit G [Ammonicoccus fulvus]|uniref:Monovalent cation/H(+) antiporter subunit G n=1 Tax=Ammonicoccus fulvus TaxID=3138240 RepID=A0ABZ3FU71_9ACTN